MSYSAVVEHKGGPLFLVRLGHRRINWDQLRVWLVIGTAARATASARRAIQRRERRDARARWGVS